MPVLTFAANVKYLRELKGFKQSDMLTVLGFKQSTWNGYERGISTPNIDDLIKISDYFKIPEHELLHIDLSTGKLIPNGNDGKNGQKGKGNGKGNGKLNVQNGDKRTGSLDTGKQYNYSRLPHIVTVNEHGIDNILYVPVKAQAGYLIGYEDPQYIETLPSFQMPGLANNTYRMFEVEGISMSPTLSDKDRVIAEWVPSFDDIRENRVHVIIHDGGIAIKRVLNRVKERQKLYLKSDTLTHRQDYPLLEIDPADIREIWYVRMRVSGDLREPSEIYNRVSDLEIHVHEMMKKLNLLSPG